MNYIPSNWIQKMQAKGDARYSLPTLFNNHNIDDEEARLAARWCYDKNPNDFDETDSELSPINKEQSDWNEKYFFHQLAVLDVNFSLERFEHTVDIRNYLRKQGHPKFQRIVKKLQPQGRGQENSAKSFLNQFPIGRLLAIGAIGIFLLLLISRILSR